jgi:hypothetical protein
MVKLKCRFLKDGEGVFLMKNIKKFLGIIVLSAVIGFLMVSCDLEKEYTWKFDNRSSLTVNISSANFSPSAFTLTAGTSRSFDNSNTSVTFQYTPANTVDSSFNSTKSGGTFTFTDK